MIIRPATASDLPELLAIYNDEVEHGVATFDTKPQTLEERRPWLEAHNVANHPLIVGVAEDGAIAGYASLSSFIAKDAYASTVELSIYVARNCRHQGVGRSLFSAILDMARSDSRTHRVISIITTENAASEALHQKFGFRKAGVLSEVGYKFGRALSVGYWELAV